MFILHVKPLVAGLSPAILARNEDVAQLIEQRIIVVWPLGSCFIEVKYYFSAWQGAVASYSNGTIKRTLNVLNSQLVGVVVSAKCRSHLIVGWLSSERSRL